MNLIFFTSFSNGSRISERNSRKRKSRFIQYDTNLCMKNVRECIIRFRSLHVASLDRVLEHVIIYFFFLFLFYTFSEPTTPWKTDSI
jgi:hypothetical protein